MAGRADLAGEQAVVFGADVGLQGLGILAAQGLLELGDYAQIGEAELADLDLAPVVEFEKVGAFLGGIVGDRLVDVEQARAGIGGPAPAIDLEALVDQGALVQRLGLIDDQGHVHGHRLADAFAGRAHAARVVVGIVAGRRQARLAQPGEQHPQHLGRVGHRRHGGAQIAAEPLLVDDDGGGDVLQHVGVRLAVVGHELLEEGRIGLVDQPLAFRRYGVEHQGRFPRARHPGEDGDPPLGDVQRDALEIVLPRPADDDRAVVGRGHRLVLPGHGL